MIIKMIVPKLGEAMYYIGKPVMNGCGARIGGIIDVKEVDDHYELTMSLKGVYSKPDRDLESFLAVNKSKNKSKHVKVVCLMAKSVQHLTFVLRMKRDIIQVTRKTNKRGSCYGG